YGQYSGNEVFRSLAERYGIVASEPARPAATNRRDERSAVRERLRTELWNARKRAGLTQKEVAAAMDWSPAKMLRIEAGAIGISTNDLRALLDCYNIDDEGHTEELLDLVRGRPPAAAPHVASTERSPTRSTTPNQRPTQSGVRGGVF